MDPSFPEAAICNSNVNDTIFAACLKTIQNSYCSSQAPLAEEGDKRHTCESQLTNIEGGDQRGSTTHTILGRHSDDGYNWRKYGQKQVKGSEYPRSYYKCTHPNCQVKKKVERAHDGQTTEIVYKGDHNHPKPLPSRRSGAASMHLNHDGEENAEAAGSLLKAELSGTCRNTDSGIFKSRDTDCSRMWKNERTERSLSTSVVTDLSDPSSTAQVQSSMCIDSQGTPEPSSNLATDDDMDDGGTNDSISFEDNSDGEEQESKRRKREQSSPDQMEASRAMHERRVVVQTTSEIDILDDGYRWRKYGQKLVKGNPNPRSYYKCTNAGCPVRKHVERASHDVKSVITTYEVKHNHGVPAARNSNPVSATKANSTVPAPVQAIVAAPPNTISHSMTQAKDIVSHFDRQFDPGSNFGTHPFLGKMMEESIHLHDNSAIRMDTKIGAAINFGMFGLEGCQSERQQIIEGTSCVEMQMPGASSHGLATFGVNPGQPIASVKLNTDVRSLRPKEEQKADSSFGNLLSYSPQMNAILYEKLLGHLPKGP